MKIKCNCVHDFQDKQYGQWVRIGTPVNKAADKGKTTEYRCTVCGKSSLGKELIKEPT